MQRFEVVPRLRNTCSHQAVRFREGSGGTHGGRRGCDPWDRAHVFAGFWHSTLVFGCVIYDRKLPGLYEASYMGIHRSDGNWLIYPLL